MRLIEPVETMQLVCRRLISESKTIRLVPTMGCLHDGHASLIKRAIEDKAEVEVATSLSSPADSRPSGSGHSRGADDKAPRRPVIVVSIFVNPLQFNDRDDFTRYPVTTERDLAMCKQLGVDYVFMPKSRDIVGHYERGASRKVSVVSADGKSSSQIIESKTITLKPPQRLARELEGRSRANHFEGMLTIVCKLFNITQPDRAYFGEKDFQQLVLVDQMTRDLNMRIKICPVGTVREHNSSLPLSSRNGRLTGDQKEAAAALMSGALIDAKHSLERKCRRSIYEDWNTVQAPSLSLETILLGSLLAAQSISSCTFEEDEIEVDYFEVRCAKDLSVIDFDQSLGLYDCQNGCLGCKMGGDNNLDEVTILEARILIAILVGRVRLLDNIDVRLNL